MSTNDHPSATPTSETADLDISAERCAQAYVDLRQAHLSLKEERLKLWEEVWNLKGRFGALQNSVEALEDDKEKLIREKRALRKENNELKDEVRSYHSHRSKDTTEALLPAEPPAPKEKPKRSESKVRSQDSRSSRGADTNQEKLERKERQRRHEEDKKRLKSRFDHKDRDSGIGSMSSGSSRRSYIDPFESSARQYNVDRSLESRAGTSYPQVKPQVIATTTTSNYEDGVQLYDEGIITDDNANDHHASECEDTTHFADPLPSSSARERETTPEINFKAPFSRSTTIISTHAASNNQSLEKLHPKRTSETQPATALAGVCSERFVECCSRQPLKINHWIENRQADFNLWIASMVEVQSSVGESFSSEFGLDLRPRELRFVKDLLANLRSCLTDCETTGEGELLEESKRNVDSALRNLTLLAKAIRQMGIMTRRLKLDENSDMSALADLRIHLVCLILVESSASKENTRYGNRPFWEQNNSYSTLSPLQQRLIEANLRRRQRFLIAQQGSDQISCQPVLSSIDGDKTMSSYKSGTDRAQPLLPSEENTISPRASGVPPRLGSQQSLSITSPAVSTSCATGISIDNESQDPDTHQTQHSLTRTATNYPKLNMPRLHIEGAGQEKLHGTMMLKCPCCCETLPYNMLEDERLWKDHLATDIYPYTCVAQDCPRPNILYRSVAKWKAHVRNHHAKTWNCQLCDESDTTIYTSPKQLSEHVREAHADSFPEQLLDTVSLWPCSISLGLNACPLCSVTGQRDSPVLIRHILEHIHDFSLRSLPWAEMPTEYEQGSAASGNYDLSYLKPLEPADPNASILPWRMHVWFEKLKLPESDQWAQAESALNNLTLHRSVHKDAGNEGYFSRNDYFASDSGHVSLDVKLDESPSLRSYDSDFNFGSERHENAAGEMFEGNNQSEDKGTKDII